MNALPEEVATFLEDRFATIRETCHYRDSYHSDYLRDSATMGQKMGSLLLKYPELEDAVVLQILGRLYDGECRGLRFFLLDRNNRRDILEHILQIHPTGRDIIFKGYCSYLIRIGYRGSILEDQNIYLWEDQALKFLETLIQGNHETEMEREARIRCAYQMAQRLRVIPGHDDYDAMTQDLTPFLRRIIPQGYFYCYVYTRFWAFYLIANPERRTEETFNHLKEFEDPYIIAHTLTILDILNPDVLEEPATDKFLKKWGKYDEDEYQGEIV
jgi:hypothetical protein